MDFWRTPRSGIKQSTLTIQPTSTVLAHHWTVYINYCNSEINNWVFFHGWTKLNFFGVWERKMPPVWVIIIAVQSTELMITTYNWPAWQSAAAKPAGYSDLWDVWSRKKGRVDSDYKTMTRQIQPLARVKVSIIHAAEWLAEINASLEVP